MLLMPSTTRLFAVPFYSTHKSTHKEDPPARRVLALQERAGTLFTAEEVASAGNRFAPGQVALALRIQYHHLCIVGLFPGPRARAISAAGQKRANEKKENVGENEENQES
jgi:hypothetical protein